MLNNQLKVGDYIFTTDGNLYRITKINKLTYSAKGTRGGWTEQVPFNGLGRYVEYFECDEPQAKAFELAVQTYEKRYRIVEGAKRTEELIGKAKYFLRHVEEFLDGIEDIEEIEPEVDFR